MVMRNKRHPVSVMLELLASGMSVEEVLAGYPGLVVQDLQACLACETWLVWKESIKPFFQLYIL